MNLPCPSCGSELTLAKLREKLAETKKRLEEERRKRYPDPPPAPGPTTAWKVSGGGAQIQPGQISNMTSSTLTLSGSNLSYDASMNDLVIGAPSYEDMTGTVKINDAVLDVCVDCGTFYAPNAKNIGDSLQKEIHELDPLMALAEIPVTGGGESG